MTAGPLNLSPLLTSGHGAWQGRFSTPGTTDGSVINPALIALGIIYVLWSWVHLPSSIWGRSLLACYLIWRMKPDVILPFVLTCAQLRIQIGASGGFDDVQSMAQQMTGFEQYAFIIPCVLYFIRTFFASVSTRVTRRAQFPFWLYNLYLFGMLFVVFGAISAYGTSGWTAGVRDYCVVGLYFYGLLMPACSKAQLMQLVFGFAILGLLTVFANLLIGFSSRQLWVLLPMAGSLAPLLFLSGGRGHQYIVASLYFVMGIVFAVKATFTLVLLWTWNVIAGVSLALLGIPSARRAVTSALTYGLLIITVFMFFFGAFTHDPSKDLLDAGKGAEVWTTYDKMIYKLRGDRGPIWWGSMVELINNPTVCGIPSPQFSVRSHNKDTIWPYSTHSILMDPLLRLGVVAGPILLLILVHAVMVSKRAVSRESDTAIAVLGLAVISNILLGGATLPYMLNERAAEHMHMVAGLLGVYGMRMRLAPPRVSSAAVQKSAQSHVVPAA
jgi:hypothetical protein